MILSRRKSSLVLVTGLVAVAIALGVTGTALASPPWSDAPDSWWQSSYGLTETQIGTVADGYGGGLFCPSLAVSRQQFVKMAATGLDVPEYVPAMPTFADVPIASLYYPYVEGSYAAGLVEGCLNGTIRTFKPFDAISRAQANSILGRYLSDVEIEATAVVHGEIGYYPTLEAWYSAEGGSHIGRFDDAAGLPAEHSAGTAYLVWRRVIEGSNNHLLPNDNLKRSAAAVMVVRTREAAEEMLLALDTVPPIASIVEPATGSTVINRQPLFLVAATDPGGSGVRQVDFQYSLDCESPVWHTISTATTPVDPPSSYAASWGSLSLGDVTHYLLRAMVTDKAGNVTTTPAAPIYVQCPI